MVEDAGGWPDAAVGVAPVGDAFGLTGGLESGNGGILFILRWDAVWSSFQLVSANSCNSLITLTRSGGIGSDRG